MCAHHNIHTLEYTCIGILQFSDELRELFIVMGLTLDACLQLDQSGLHYLRQVKQGSLVSHHPCLHVINNNMHVQQDTCSSSTSLLPSIEMDNCFMHVPNLEYNACMTVLRDNTSSSIAFFNSAWMDVVTNSPPCLAICSSFAIQLFSTIKRWTLELVDLT